MNWELFKTFIIYYIIGYIVSFAVFYYKRIQETSFYGKPIELIKEFFLSFAWPIIAAYVIVVFVLSYIAIFLATIYVYVKDFFQNVIFRRNKNKITENVIEEEEEPQENNEEEEE